MPDSNLASLLMSKKEKIYSFLKCCKAQKKLLMKKNYKGFFQLQKQKWKIVNEIKDIDRFLSTFVNKTEQTKEIGRNIKKGIKEILKKEEELQKEVRKQYAELQLQLDRLNKGLQLVRHYKWKGQEKRSKFLDFQG
ncbi:MAG: hypothetical protein LWW95_08620 [Candidatus Desulfofervidus auxilii]|nr:hypothetical protein [Candidatus Desulfofervidus auxilii]